MKQDTQQTLNDKWIRPIDKGRIFSTGQILVSRFTVLNGFKSVSHRTKSVTIAIAL